MENKKIAIFGASGLVGSRLSESLYLNKRYDFRALFHTPGNAFGIAKYPMDIEQVNLLDRGQVYKSLRDCSVIINCSRGGPNIMLQGFKNLLGAAEKRKIWKIIHISSVLIYGENPPKESSNEDCPPNPGGNDYGLIKLKQDHLLLKRKDSFQSIILCPPNIYGPYSGFTYTLMNYIQSGIIALVDGGKNPCNLVHVDNLVLAIYKALENDSIHGERFFIRDDGEPCWKDLFLQFAEIMGKQIKFMDFESSLIEKDIVNKNGIIESCSKTFKYFLSPEFRNVLSNLPLFNKLLNSISYRINCLEPRLQKILREKLSAPIVVPKEPDLNSSHKRLLSLQTRKVSHSIQKAKNILGYQPFFNLQNGLENTKVWMKFYNFI